MIPIAHEELMRLRASFSLELKDAAAILEVSEEVYFMWESGTVPCLYSSAHCRNRFTCQARLIDQSKDNLIFRVWNLKTVRNILGLNLMQMSAQYASTPNTWKKYEAGHRQLPHDILMQIQDDVREFVAGVISYNLATD